MPRFAANLTLMFTEVAFLDRFDAAASAGFTEVELMFPYEHAPEEVAQRIHDNNLNLVLINAPAGDWDAGERGLAAFPERQDEFRASITRAIEYARKLRVPAIHVMAGIVDPSEESERTYVESIRHAADAAAPHDIQITIEPINPYSIPGYFLRGLPQAVDLITRIDRENVKLQFDIFHVQQTDGDLTHWVEKLAPLIGHVQVARVPDRGEPDDTGEVNNSYVYSVLEKNGYVGPIGAEYVPTGKTEENLGWFGRR